MADNVTGQIGADQVFLENAATEATLRLLLQATLATTKEQRKAISDLVQKAGLDPTKVQAANAGLANISTAAVKVDSALTIVSDKVNKVFQETARIVGQFTNNTMEASGVFGEFIKIGGPVGLVAAGFQKLAEYQEASLQSYRTLTSSGISFGGSLTNLRLAASNSYMSLDNFTKMMAANSDTLARMGGSTETGIRAFSELSKELNKSGGVGDGLRAMGYSSEQMNQSMLSYIAITGGRTKSELTDKAALTKSAGEYMEKMDQLAEITGKTREQQEKDLKAAMEKADIELYTASLSKDDREKFSAVYNDALQKYGQGAADNVLAAAQGRAVTTEAGQKYAALAPMATKSLQDQTAATMKYGALSRQAIDAENSVRVNNSKEWMKFSGVLGSATGVLKGNEAAAIQAAKDKKSGQDSLAKLDEAERERKEKKAAQDISEAKDAAETQKALREMGGVIMEKIVAPIGKFLMPVLNSIIQSLSKFVLWVSQSNIAFYGLTGIVVAVTGLMIAWKAAAVAGAVKKGVGGLVSGLTEGGGGGGKAAGGGIGSALSGIGKGAGEGLQGLAKGLGALGTGRVLVGIAALVGIAGALYVSAKAFREFTGIDWVQVGIGTLAIAGIATAAALAAPAAPLIGVTALALLGLGAALLVMSNGLNAISGAGKGSDALLGLGKKLLQFEIDTPYVKLGLAAIPLAAFGGALSVLAMGLRDLQNTDTVKLDKIAESLAKIKAASPPEKSIIASAGDAIKSTFGGGAGGGGAGGDSSDLLRREIQMLNKQTTDLLRAMREAADNTAKTASLIAGRGNPFIA